MSLRNKQLRIRKVKQRQQNVSKKPNGLKTEMMLDCKVSRDKRTKQTAKETSTNENMKTMKPCSHKKCRTINTVTN